MTAFTLRAVLDGGVFSHGYGIGALEVASFGGQTQLYAASAADGGLAVFQLLPGSAAQIVSQVSGSATTGTLGVSDIEIAVVGSVGMIISAGRSDDQIAFRGLDATGDFAGLMTLPPMAQSTAGLSEVEIITFGTTSLLITGRDTAAGLDVYALTGAPGLSAVTSLADSVGATLANVADLALHNTGTTHLAFAVSSLEHGVTSLRIDSGGGLSVVDMVDGMKGLGIFQPSSVRVAEVGASDFLLLGATGSSNLSVFEISPDGQLALRDMVWDSLKTRFQGVSALDTFVVNDRSFVLAGGRDGGVTLFELDPTGRLHLVTSVIDTATTTLASVSAIRSVVVGGDVQVFVSSATEDGITQFSLDMGSIGSAVTASATGGGAVGGPGDDLVIGTAGRDDLWGMSGADILVDGAGLDTLHGGAGADVFVFRPDGGYDVIADYQHGSDRIDLSGFERLFSISGLVIESTSYGARISEGYDVILLHSLDGQPLSAAQFSDANFIFS